MYKLIKIKSRKTEAHFEKNIYRIIPNNVQKI